MKLTHFLAILIEKVSYMGDILSFIMATISTIVSQYNLFLSEKLWWGALCDYLQTIAVVSNTMAKKHEADFFYLVPYLFLPISSPYLFIFCKWGRDFDTRYRGVGVVNQIL